MNLVVALHHLPLEVIPVTAMAISAAITNLHLLPLGGGHLLVHGLLAATTRTTAQVMGRQTKKTLHAAALAMEEAVA